MFIIFPKSRNTFRLWPYQNAYENVFRNVYHRTLCRVEVERKALSRRSCCIAQLDPWSRYHEGRAPLRRSVGDVHAFQKRVYYSLQKRVSGSNALQIALFSAFQKGVSNPVIKTALRLSSAEITLKVVWKP